MDSIDCSSSIPDFDPLLTEKYMNKPEDKNEVSHEVTPEGDLELKDTPSPFIKHCENLSPLYDRGRDTFKRQKIHSDFKFNVEFMKSPALRSLSITSECGVVGECSPAKLEFGCAGGCGVNDTPSFNSQFDHEIMRVPELAFLVEKENLQQNLGDDEENFAPNVVRNGVSDEQLDDKWRELQNSAIVQKVSQQNECKSDSNTSPGSNARRKNCHPKAKISKNGSKKVLIHKFYISSVDFKITAEGPKVPKLVQNRRVEKLSYKKSVAVNDPNGSKNGIKPFKGCTCKKSQCKKLYCECFQNKRVCTSHCGCNDC